MQISAIIVHLPEELLKDAQWHYEQAKAHQASNPGDPFPVWRHVRSAAVFAVTSLEALLNMEADRFVRENPGHDPIILAYLQEHEIKVRDGVTRNVFRMVSLDDKVKHWTKIITGRDFDRSDKDWQRFREVKDFRDNLIHYKPGISNTYNQGTVAMAKDAVDSALAMIVRYYACLGQPPSPWTSQIKT